MVHFKNYSYLTLVSYEWRRMTFNVFLHTDSTDKIYIVSKLICMCCKCKVRNCVSAKVNNVFETLLHDNVSLNKDFVQNVLCSLWNVRICIVYNLISFNCGICFFYSLYGFTLDSPLHIYTNKCVEYYY